MSEDNDKMKLDFSDKKVKIDQSNLVNDILPPENTIDQSSFKKTIPDFEYHIDKDSFKQPEIDINNHYILEPNDHIPSKDEDIDSMINDEESNEKENNGMTR